MKFDFREKIVNLVPFLLFYSDKKIEKKLGN